MTASAPAIDFISLMGPVARLLLGEPNAKLSSDRELRFGTHGSLCVDLEKGVWKSFEDDQGGGVLDLIEREKGLTGAAAFRWLEENHLKEPNSNVHRLSIIVETYPYVDAGGHCRYEVVRFDPKDFRQRRRDANGDWIWNLHGVQPLPYRLPELIEAIANDNVVFVVEGEKDVHSLTKLGIPSTCNSGGAGNWNDKINHHFADADVVVIADNDPQAADKNGKPLFHKDGRPKLPGQDHANHICKILQGIAKRVRYLDLKTVWQACPPKGDITNWFKAGGTIEQLWAIVEDLPDYVPVESVEAPETAAPSGKLTAFNAEELNKMRFDPIKYVVPGYIVEGLTLIAGKPKIGKSWLLLHVAIAVANGSLTLDDVRCIEGDVLYCALEDNKRRLQSRLTKLLGTYPWPRRLQFICEMPRLSAGGLDYLKQWIAAAEHPRLIIIDTFAMVRTPSTNRNQSMYDADYEAVKELRAVANQYNVAIVLVHHLRKQVADDAFDTVSGTLGLTGAPDTVLVIQRDASGNTVLHGRGRDLVEIEKALTFNKDTCVWSITGDARVARLTAERAAIIDAITEAGEPLTPKGIAEVAGMKSANVRKLLAKLVTDGNLKKKERGKYGLPL